MNLIFYQRKMLGIASNICVKMNKKMKIKRKEQLFYPFFHNFAHFKIRFTWVLFWIRENNTTQFWCFIVHFYTVNKCDIKEILLSLCREQWKHSNDTTNTRSEALLCAGLSLFQFVLFFYFFLNPHQVDLEYKSELMRWMTF